MISRTLGCFAAGLIMIPAVGFAVVPVVKTVPWVASNPLIPHDTWSGKQITLKGTCDMQGANIQYTWDFGDGSPVASGTVGNMYAIEAIHAYTGPVGTVFTATLTVQNTSTGESASKQYYVKIEAQTLPVEVNVAIDEGLWYLHKTQTRTGSEGYWASSGYFSQTASSVNAFEVNGHLEGGSPDNPYTETVSRGMRRLFTYLARYNIGPQAFGNPDSNGNGFGIYVPQYPDPYQLGMFMDAIVASGTPLAVAPTGPLGVVGRSYKDIVQDMVDYYAFAQYDDNTTYGGGWRYGPNQFPDNSASQWAAIGLIPAERNWGCTVPSFVKTANVVWLTYSQRADGVYGYTSSEPLSGVPFGTTPSGLVQCAMGGIGRGNALWDKAETYLRDNFVAPTAYWHFKNNYYGMFAFVKAMLLHDSNGDGVGEPIQFLQSSTPGVPPIDWYSAEASKGDPSDGLARKIVNDQTKVPNANYGRWFGYGWFDNYGYETAWAIIMLQRTLFEAGAPVAVAKANPNPAVAGQIVQLDGSDSYHQDATKTIDSWEWDLDNNGTYDVSGPFPTVSFPVVGNYPVKLRVTDDSSPEKSAETVITILVNTPPIAPTADAGGPYNFCLGQPAWFLDATGSVNPDDGVHQAGPFPGDFIKSYEWDLDGDGQFDDAFGPQPDVTAFFTAKGPGSYLIQVRATDNTAASFPASNLGDLSDTDSATVTVRSSTDPECVCVDNLAARPKSRKIQLGWTYTGAHHYNVYRGTIAGGPYLHIGSTASGYSTYLDGAVVNGVTYYYVVREANLLDQETCQSNEASAKASSR